MAFEKLKRAANPLLKEVLSHPFNTQLFNGTLHSRSFEYFLANDAVYLNHYAKLLKALSDRLEIPEHKWAFQQFSSDTVSAELELHKVFVREKLSVPCESIANYLAHLNTQIKHPHVGVGIASVLPCFWLYRELGKHMAMAQIDTSHSYKLWVETYACPKFDGATELAIKVLDEVADSKYESAMRFAFLKSAKHELAFWEEAHRFCSPGFRITPT